LYSGISDFKKGYHPRTNIVKDEKGDLFADSHSTLARWRNHFSQPLEYAVRRVKVNQDGLKLNGTQYCLVYAKDVGRKHTY
jgi:hypothetical protein